MPITIAESKRARHFSLSIYLDGTKFWEYYNATGSTDDRQYMNFSIPAAPTAVDLNNDGYIDRVYIGDVGGQLWKFDVAPTGGATLSGSLITNWTGKRFFAAASSQTNPPAAGEYYPTQAIYFPPALAYDAARETSGFSSGPEIDITRTIRLRTVFTASKKIPTMTNGSAR